ncbi:hypothetical protein B5G09_06320 [Alistipes sp. An54]|nr:hypothetical protein B5G09_06320 [Alistipes sp. An54]
MSPLRGKSREAGKEVPETEATTGGTRRSKACRQSAIISGETEAGKGATLAGADRNRDEKPEREATAEGGTKDISESPEISLRQENGNKKRGPSERQPPR